MSATQVALLPPSGRHDAAPRVQSVARPERPLVRLVTFGALALYGVTRWATLMQPSGGARLVGLLALALLLAGAGPLLARRSRVAAAVVAVLAVLAAFALAGVPLAWVVHVRVAVTASAIGQGLSALPRALVPYNGVNQLVRLVTTLGAAVLLLDGAVLLAFAPRALGDLRRAGVALPLVALAAVPDTLLPPALPYVAGLVLFGLLAAFMWAERLERGHRGAAVALCAGAAVTAMILAPGLDQHQPWLNYEALATRLVKTHVETFNWSQTYGPVRSPHAGRAVLDVQASRPDYWKAENLDEFDGTGWGLGTVFQAGGELARVSSANIRRWTETLKVTVGAMSTTDVIAAGDASAPRRLAETLQPGVSPGTWTTTSQIGPGDSYSVKVYAPDPSAAQLAAAGDRYPENLLDGYLTVGIPAVPGPGHWVVYPPFHSTQSAFVLSEHAKPRTSGPSSIDPGFATLDSLRVAKVMAVSPYARAYELAQRLARAARTPYAFVTAVEGYLAHGYAYTENPPQSRYPLETFLFSSRKGYCQQFAGAMALLLRMGGVPARVAVGFTQGDYHSATKEWVVSDLDAHAWVEAWFPGYGWVKFDPTPPQDPALGGHPPSSPNAGALSARANFGKASSTAPAPASSTVHHRGSGSTASTPVIVWVATALAVLALLACALGLRPLAPGEQQLAELERAFARSGRPLAAGVTLAALERRLAAAPAAAGYVRALRLQRFGAVGDPPTATQRRALRAQLGAGRGPLGRLRSLWALPPRRRARGRLRGA